MMNSAMLLHTAEPVRAVPPAASTPQAAAPAAMAYTVQRSSAEATVNPAMLQWRNPVFGGWQLYQPKPRSSFALPTLISPVNPPVDTTLFQEPQDASLLHNLPGYTIATQGSGGSLTKWVSFAPSAQGFTLIVNLAQTPAPGNATPIVPTAGRYMLTAVDGGQNVSWDFSTVTASGNTLNLQLTVTSIGDRDSIYRVMTTPAANCKLVLRRSFAVASLVAPTAANPGPLYQASTPAIDTDIPFTFDINLDHNVFSQLSGVSNTSVGLNTYHVTWQQRSYPYYQDPNEPTQIYFLPDGFKISRRASAPHAPSISISSSASSSDPSTQIYVLSFLAVPVWDPNRIQDAAPKLAAHFTLGTTPTLTPFEATNTSLALNLPAADSSVSGLAPVSGATIDVGAGVSASVTLSLAQLQQVYSALFDDVSMLLSGVVTVTVGQGTTADVVKLPLSARATDFSGNLFDTVSQVDPTFHRITQTHTNAIESPILVQALTGVLVRADQTTIPSVAQQVWPTLPVTLPPPAAATAVPTSGTTTSSSTAATGTDSSSSDAAAGAVLGSVLGAVLGGFGIPTTPAPPTAGPQPTTPANGMAFAIAVAAGTPLDSTCSVVYDFSNTQVQPDADAIWDAIMQSQVLSPMTRPIQVMVFASVFNAPPAPATSATSATSTDPSSTTAPAPVSSPLRAIQVIFADGQTANFDASTPATAGILSQTVSLTVPIKDYVLRQGDTSTYTYSISTIRDSGSTTGAPITSNQDSFYVEVGS